jgi:hypothetical protein
VPHVAVAVGEGGSGVEREYAEAGPR